MDEVKIDEAVVADVADVALPDKAPVRLEILLSPDESGLKLKDVVAAFVFKYPKDPCSGGAERVALQFDDEMRKNLDVLFSKALEVMCKKHSTCSAEEALKFPVPAPQPVG